MDRFVRFSGLHLLSFLTCLPLIAADIPAVLALDQRCLGGLWTHSGYQRELESDCSDLCVLVSADTAEILQKRQSVSSALPSTSEAATSLEMLAAGDFTCPSSSSILLLGIGCLWAILEEAHITTLAIEPQHQGQKLGLLLLSHLLACGRRRGLTRATLEVRMSNNKALKLYQKFDFAEAGQRKRYYSDGENARILWRSGLQHDDCRNQIAHHREIAIEHIEQQGKHQVLLEIT